MDQRLYDILNLHTGASEEEVCRRYRRLYDCYYQIYQTSGDYGVRDMAAKRLYQLEQFQVGQLYMHFDAQPQNTGLLPAYEQALAVLDGGTNSTAVESAVQHLKTAIEAEPQNLIYQTLLSILAEVGR